jgi:hypothetical protein
MRRLLALACLLVPLAAPAGAAAQDRVRLRAQLVSCRTGDAPSERAATFRASMPAMRRTRRMLMRFELRRRVAGRLAFRRVDVPAWRDWARSEPRRDGFVFTRRVDGLRAGADYRALVRFRWYDADGREQRRTRRLTELCEQPRRGSR